MPWDVRFAAELALEFSALSDAVKLELLAQAKVLERFGPLAGRPRVDTLNGSMYMNMKELRFNADGGIWRLAFAFDPERHAVLLVVGNKSGRSQSRFYHRLIAIADERFTRHLSHCDSEAGKK